MRRYMSVNFGCLAAFMTKQILYVSYINSSLNHRAGITISQTVQYEIIYRQCKLQFPPIKSKGDVSKASVLLSVFNSSSIEQISTADDQLQLNFLCNLQVLF